MPKVTFYWSVMLVSIISYSFDTHTKFLRSITLKLTAEALFESPLHQLPELLVLLDAKSLNTYGIRFEKNTWGRFDIEIQSDYPPICGEIIAVDMAKKMKRLIRYYYETKENPHATSMPYHDFIAFLNQYKPPYSSWKNSELYQMSPQWEQLADAYRTLSPETDVFYTTLAQRNLRYKRPPMGDKSCRFDQVDFIENQMILQYGAFAVVFNFRPQGDTKFHLMINSLQHSADLSTATARDLFELETLFRTVFDAAQRVQHNEKIMIYMQKHASMGMTVPHLHIHVLLAPARENLSHDVLQEFRFIMTSILHPGQNNPHVKPPLSDEVMQRQKGRLALELSEGLNKQIMMQYQHFSQPVVKKYQPLSLFSRPRLITFKPEKKLEVASTSEQFTLFKKHAYNVKETCFFIGVEGGSTSCTVKIKSLFRTLGEYTLAEGVNIISKPPQEAWQIILTAINRLLHSNALALANPDIQFYACFGLSGAAHPSSKEQFITYGKQHHDYFHKLTVEPDSYITWLSAHKEGAKDFPYFLWGGLTEKEPLCKKLITTDLSPVDGALIKLEQEFQMLASEEMTMTCQL